MKNQIDDKLWIVTCEVVVKPGELASGNTNAFVNVVAQADSQDDADEKSVRYLELQDFHVVSIEASCPVYSGRMYDDDIAELIDGVRNEPRSILHGRFFSYKGD